MSSDRETFYQEVNMPYVFLVLKRKLHKNNVEVYKHYYYENAFDDDFKIMLMDFAYDILCFERQHESEASKIVTHISGF